jgi:hypothetical protein
MPPSEPPTNSPQPPKTAPSITVLDIPDKTHQALTQLAAIFTKALPRVDAQPPRVPETASHTHRYPTRNTKAINLITLPPPQRQYIGRSRTWTHHALQALLTVEGLKPRIPDTPLHDIVIPITGAADPFIPFANSVIDATTGEAYKYKQLITLPQYREKWLRSSSNEFGRLAQGIRDVAGTDTITFIAKSDIPHGRSVTYAQFVATLRPHQKTEIEQTRLRRRQPH